MRYHQIQLIAFINVILNLFLLSNLCNAQDKDYVLTQTKALTAKKYWGRGYTKSGMEKASLYLQKEYHNLGLLPLFNGSFRQAFEFPVNTFPGKAHLELNGRHLQPGKDFIVKANSMGKKVKGEFRQIDSLTWEDQANSSKLSIVPKLTWSVGRTEASETHLQLLKPVSLPPKFPYKINLEQKLVPDFKAYNVGGWIKGTLRPDEYLVITAHYDHLGGLGSKTYFPGANDNASGVAFMLSLAKYYAQNPPEYSIVFLAFAAEEAGLLGSKYYTEHPAFELSKIKFLFNFDLMGNGEQGATIVNASVFPKQFELLKGINNSGKYLSALNPRGKAANSDHYHFSEKGVPAFFMYTQGGGPAYHDIDDQAKNITFPVYDKLFELIQRFHQEVMKP